MEDSVSSQKVRRQNRFIDRFGEDNPYALDILKGHLLIEEVLEEIIMSVCRNQGAALEARMGFFTKAKLAQAIDGRASAAWLCIEKLNLARNELAHGRDISVLEKKIDSFVSCVRQGFKAATWKRDRSFNLAIAIAVVHAAASRIAADHAHA